MTSEREPVDDAALIAEAERLDEARNLEAIRRSPVVGPGDPFNAATAFDHYRELVRTGWQPHAPEPDRAEVLAKELWENGSGANLKDWEAIIRRHLSELRAEWKAERPVIDVPSEVVGSLERLVAVIKMAGVYNLSNGVQLGQMSWMVKCKDAIAWAEKALSLIDGAGVRAKPENG